MVKSHLRAAMSVLGSRPNNPHRRGLVQSVALIVLLVSAGCSSQTTAVRDIMDNPNDYVTTEVTIEGRVTSSKSIPLTTIGVFWLNDGTAEIPVLPLGAVPANEQVVRVTGVVSDLATVMGFGIAVHLRETGRMVVEQ